MIGLIMLKITKRNILILLLYLGTYLYFNIISVLLCLFFIFIYNWIFIIVLKLVWYKKVNKSLVEIIKPQ